MQLNQTYFNEQQAFVDSALANSNADYNLVIVSARAMHAYQQRICPLSGVC